MIGRAEELCAGAGLGATLGLGATFGLALDAAVCAWAKELVSNKRRTIEVGRT